jgi:hypothetical protein
MLWTKNSSTANTFINNSLCNRFRRASQVFRKVELLIHNIRKIC